MGDRSAIFPQLAPWSELQAACHRDERGSDGNNELTLQHYEIEHGGWNLAALYRQPCARGEVDRNQRRSYQMGDAIDV